MFIPHQRSSVKRCGHSSIFSANGFGFSFCPAENDRQEVAVRDLLERKLTFRQLKYFLRSHWTQKVKRRLNFGLTCHHNLILCIYFFRVAVERS